VKKENAKHNIPDLFIKLINLQKKLIFFRPKDIPLIVPDCGWNHGETSEINETIERKKNKQ
jgi:hypothetical protein